MQSRSAILDAGGSATLLGCQAGEAKHGGACLLRSSGTSMVLMEGCALKDCSTIGLALCKRSSAVLKHSSVTCCGTSARLDKVAIGAVKWWTHWEAASRPRTVRLHATHNVNVCVQRDASAALASCSIALATFDKGVAVSGNSKASAPWCFIPDNA